MEMGVQCRTVDGLVELKNIEVTKHLATVESGPTRCVSLK